MTTTSTSTSSASFTTSDDHSIAFSRYPAPAVGAPRLALVHSLALDRSVWDAVVEQLRGVAELMTLDCRGHGRSDHRTGEYTADLFARDLAELFDHVGWTSAAVAGCSMGGCVALAFAGRYPDRTTTLGLIDTTAWYGDGAPARFRERAAEARSKGMAALIDFQLTRWFSEAFRASHPETIAHVMSVFLANDLDCYASTCALLGDADLREFLPLLRMPVAIIVGEQDHATPLAMAQQLHEQIPQSTLDVLPDARHLTPIECPDAVAAILRGLVTRA